MGVKGDNINISKQLKWSDTKKEDIYSNAGWSEDAFNPDMGIVFRMYFNEKNKNVYLHDIFYDVTYEVPYGAKAKGYTLAFKLFTKGN